jgi:hypothetical protein
LPQQGHASQKFRWRASANRKENTMLSKLTAGSILDVEYSGLAMQFYAGAAKLAAICTQNENEKTSMVPAVRARCATKRQMELHRVFIALNCAARELPARTTFA